MMSAVSGAFANLHISSRPRAQLSFRASVCPGSMLVLPRPGVARSALAFLVEAKQNSLRRERTSEKARLRNKGRTSEIKTRIKKVLTAVDAAQADLPKAESDLSELAALMSEAYRVIDKGVSKGVLHKNTAARRKARIARARQNLLISAGLYKAPESTPDVPEASLPSENDGISPSELTLVR
ncbi:PRPS20 [Auxenochlorella protothecoides x Auxenochlorella symbiontica]